MLKPSQVLTKPIQVWNDSKEPRGRGSKLYYFGGDFLLKDISELQEDPFFVPHCQKLKQNEAKWIV